MRQIENAYESFNVLEDQRVGVIQLIHGNVNREVFLG